MTKLSEKINGVPFIALVLLIATLLVTDCVLNFNVSLLLFYAMLPACVFVFLIYTVSDLHTTSLLMLPLIVYELVFLPLASDVGQLLCTQLYPWAWIIQRSLVLVFVIGIQGYIATQMARYFLKDWLCTIAVLATATVVVLMIWRFPLYLVLPALAVAITIALCGKKFAPALDKAEGVATERAQKSESSVRRQNEPEQLLFVDDREPTVELPPTQQRAQLSSRLIEELHKAEIVEQWKHEAEKGDAEAQFKLAWEGYLEGNGGLDHDMAAALKWLWKAKKQGHTEASKMIETLVHNYKQAKELFSSNDLEAMRRFVKRYKL